ncbi:hypothetical protein ACFQ0G_20730 [Streptomyces chiangmaiensis]
MVHALHDGGRKDHRRTDGEPRGAPPSATITEPPMAMPLPTTTWRVTGSKRNALPSTTLKTGATAISMLAVPAETCTSPQLSRIW